MSSRANKQSNERTYAYSIDIYCFWYLNESKIGSIVLSFELNKKPQFESSLIYH